ncbi:MAG TPA: sulfur carrier protein ThiS [Geopsychrobacteraceae bacterium]
MQLQINGEAVQAEDRIDVGRLLSRLELNPQLVVVELNRRILTPEDFSETALTQGDVLEIVQFVGGG